MDIIKRAVIMLTNGYTTYETVAQLMREGYAKDISTIAVQAGLLQSLQEIDLDEISDEEILYVER